MNYKNIKTWHIIQMINKTLQINALILCLQNNTQKGERQIDKNHNIRRTEKTNHKYISLIKPLKIIS